MNAAAAPPVGQHTLVLQATVDDLTGDEIPFLLHHIPVGDWMHEMGLDDVRALAVFEVDGHYHLHVSQLVRTDAGDIVLDRALGRVATRPRIIDLGTEPCWPECLNEPHYQVRRGSWLLLADARHHVAIG